MMADAHVSPRHFFQRVERERARACDQAADLERPICRRERHHVGNEITWKSSVGCDVCGGRLGCEPRGREYESFDALVPALHPFEKNRSGATIASGKSGGCRDTEEQLSPRYQATHHG